MFEIPAELSPRARAYLQSKARRAEERRPYARDFPDDLAARVEALDQIWGGLGFDHHALGVMGTDVPGAAPLREVDGTPVALFATTWSRDPVYVDARGQLYARKRWWPTAPLHLMAGSVASFIERWALIAWIESRPLAAELDRRMAASLGAALGLAAMPGATAEDASWWGSGEADGLFVCDGLPLAPAESVTTIQGPLKLVLAALRQARGLDVDVGAHVHPCNPRSGNGGDHNPPFELASPDRAPAGPSLGAHVLPLRVRSGARWDQRRRQGVVDLRDEAGIRVLETHAGAVVKATSWTEAGVNELRYMEGSDRIAPMLSTQARANLVSDAVGFDPRDVLEPQEVAKILRRVGIEQPDRIVALDQELGGLQFGESFHGERFGVFVTLRGVLELEDEGNRPYLSTDGRVDFGSVGDARYLADEHGRLHFVDDIDGTDILVAETAKLFLERKYRGNASLEPSTGPDLFVGAYVGERLAGSLGAALIPELSDAAERYWSSGAVLIHERPAREGEVSTHVVCASLAVAANVIAQLVGASPAGARHWTHWIEVRGLLAGAGLAVDRVHDERYWEPPDPIAARELATRIRGEASVAELVEAAAHGSAMVRRAVVERLDLPREALVSVVAATPTQTLEDVIVIDAAARHPAADAALLDHIAALVWPPPLSTVAARAAAMNPSASAALLDRLLAHGSPEVRQAVALNPSAGTERIARLCGDPDPHVRRTAAEHAAAPAKSLAALAQDDDRWVRLAVASHPHTPDESLVVLAGDPDSSIAYNLASRPTLPSDVATRIAYHPWSLRDRPCAHPSLTLDALRDLARSPDRDTRRGVASNPATPPELLAVLVADHDPEIRKLAVGHPATPPACVPSELGDQLDELRERHPIHARAWKGPPGLAPTAALGPLVDQRSPSKGAWAGHPTFPAGLLAAQLDHPELLVGLAAAGHPWVGVDVLASLITHPYAYARAAAARHPHTPSEALERAAADEASLVRAAVASHPRLPLGHVERLSADADDLVREAVGTRIDCPPSILARLAEDPHEYVRRGVARNPKAPTQRLESLADDPHVQVRSHLPLNPACPASLAERLLTDPERRVRDAAVWRLLADRPLAELL